MKTPLANKTILGERYEIVKILGAGDFGTVYQARDLQETEIHPMVAIKQMPMQMIVDCERQADWRAMLVHPAIPRIYGYFSSDEYSYLVEEFIQGWNLETVMDEQNGFLPEKTVIDWAIQLCNVLDYLHNHPYYPMIFRDLKPNNVMVDLNTKIHLVDFGLARVYPPRFFQEPQSQFEHLWKGLEIGTEGFSPPEQYQGFVVPQSDLYALGATLHNLLTRRDPRHAPPFSFDKFPVRSLNRLISEGLESVVMKALNRDLDQRFSTAKDMGLALEKLIEAD